MMMPPPALPATDLRAAVAVASNVIRASLRAGGGRSLLPSLDVAASKKLREAYEIMVVELHKAHSSMQPGRQRECDRLITELVSLVNGGAPDAEGREMKLAVRYINDALGKDAPVEVKYAPHVKYVLFRFGREGFGHHLEYYSELQHPTDPCCCSRFQGMLFFSTTQKKLVLVDPGSLRGAEVVYRVLGGAQEAITSKELPLDRVYDKSTEDARRLLCIDPNHTTIVYFHNNSWLIVNPGDCAMCEIRNCATERWLGDGGGCGHWVVCGDCSKRKEIPPGRKCYVCKKELKREAVAVTGSMLPMPAISE